MNADDLNRYLRAHIPLSVHMGMEVVLLEPARVQVLLPLAPNLNPHGTVFGGALAALGLATGWMLLHAAFARADLAVKLVGKQSECLFLAPATTDSIAEACCAEIDLDLLLARFRDQGRARQEVETVIRVGDIDVARHRGVYSALAH